MKSMYTVLLGTIINTVTSNVSEILNKDVYASTPCSLIIIIIIIIQLSNNECKK